jgi:hypothetical protein
MKRSERRARMKGKVKREWLRLLRSGEYAQIRNTLCIEDSDGTRRFCIIGILAQIYLSEHADEKGWRVSVLGTERALKGSSQFKGAKWPKVERGQSLMIPCGPREGREFGDALNDWAGIDRDVSCDLTEMNDKKKASFEELADWIEENLKVDLENFVVKDGNGMSIVVAEDSEHARSLSATDHDPSVQLLSEVLAKSDGPGVLESIHT